MNRFYTANKAGFRERINIAILLKLPGPSVLQWMKENHKELEQSVYMDMRHDPEDRTVLEYCLYRRNEPLIDLSLALYGYNSEVLKRIYKRADVGTRLAALANPKGSVFVLEGQDLFLNGSNEELRAFFSNPNLAGGLFTNLFERKHGFKDLTDDRLLKLIDLCAGHPRLKAEYTSLFMDGGDEYEYHLTFDSAWSLAKTAPLTKEWGWALAGLLSKCVVPAGFKDAMETINRWRIAEDSKEDGKWYSRGPFFELRSTLAKLLKEEDLINSDDLALRVGFYRIFDPRVFKDFSSFLERDGEEFVHAAMSNQTMWKTEELRRSLSRMAWDCPDPGSHLEMPNHYRLLAKRFEQLHPEWFVEEKDKDELEATPDPVAEGIEALQRQVSEIETSLAALQSKLPSNVGWWVAAGLLAFHMFGRG
jgi:hypothetical protein